MKICARSNWMNECMKMMKRSWLHTMTTILIPGRRGKKSVRRLSLLNKVGIYTNPSFSLPKWGLFVRSTLLGDPMCTLLYSAPGLDFIFNPIRKVEITCIFSSPSYLYDLSSASYWVCCTVTGLCMFGLRDRGVYFQLSIVSCGIKTRALIIIVIPCLMRLYEGGV